MTTARLRYGRASLAFGFLVQGVTFALLVTRIPAIQDRYGISDGLLPAFLAAVPVLAGVASVATEKVVARVRPGVVLRWAQPVVMLALLGVGAGGEVWQAALALGVFGLAVGALDASMNMMGVSLQRAYGRSIMLGFHAAYSLGGIAGASMAWAGAHWDLSLLVSYLPAVAVLLPAVLVGSRWYAEGDVPRGVAAGAGPGGAAPGKGPSVPFRLLLPLCLVMSFAYIGDSTVSNWSAKYLQDVLGSSEQLATVPYNVYMVTTLLGRAVGDLGVRRFGAVGVVRAGSVLAAVGFAVVAVAPGAWWGMLGFTLLGLGLCVIVPQTFAAAGRMFPGASDVAVARLNVFNYVGFLVGSPLVGALGDAWSYRGAMLVPMVLVLATLVYARSFGADPARYGGGHERARAADVG
ncbi:MULTISPECIES: MFS transporter [unclassified Streptomyces]|uniref:MFS transporter n=1 Tax=Streptomyces TaxID=1883 RepID=UPI0001C1A851|nr:MULTISPECIES: MFS transporter [unclassified Streptomyces]AEN10673.1 major facilitator superfamily MFS_1 [Streptomyces sp. SirexAA-E]PZX35314.1 MFS transporter [Streptomyces sp. DvalAA-21]RAJ30160.1 MFS transporter [Streptomyces sp. DpondAA-E10]RAJ44606.1 MFS transporter [Streptomyces sp. DpondAA-A50]SCE42991.1 Major Facilitator Superfamily protein [Streptomyces sp. DpondAA-F4a]